MACGCGCGRASHFTTKTPGQMRRTLGQKLICVADNMRDLLTDFGLRPYTVSIVRTRWSSGVRGVGEEIIVSTEPLLPTPMIADLTGVNAIVSAAGLNEQGEVMLTKVSGRYTDEFLRGLGPDGSSIPAGDQLWYEVTFPRVDGLPGERRRFFPSSAPYYDAPGLQWRVQLRRQQADRQRNGDIRR